MAALIEDRLYVREEFEVQHDHLVREEIETFRRKAQAFLAGEITEDEFRAVPPEARHLRAAPGRACRWCAARFPAGC